MSLWTWLAKIFRWVKTDATKIAVAITEGVQTALKSGVVGALAEVISAIFPNVKHLPQDVVDSLGKIIPKVLAAELAIQGLPDNPTEEDILEFEKLVLSALGVKNDKSKLWSTLSAEIYGMLREYTSDGKLTWAETIELVERAYQAYVADKAAIDAGEAE